MWRYRRKAPISRHSVIDIRLFHRWQKRARASIDPSARRRGSQASLPPVRPLLVRTIGVVAVGVGLLLLTAAVALGVVAQRQVHRDVTRALDVAARAVTMGTSHEQAAAFAHGAGAAVAVIADGRLVDSGLPALATRDLQRVATRPMPEEGTAVLGGERYAFRHVRTSSRGSEYALSSIDARWSEATRDRWTALVAMAIGASLLVLATGLWVGRTIGKPIGDLSTSIEELTSTRDLHMRLTPSGISRELDTLTDTFNHLLLSLSVAERATETAYTGAIRALAAAVDARDPNTTGHSERVSALAVAIGQRLGVSDQDLEVVRLGALLHDIGKICVPDSVLRKPEPLTEAEHALVKQHPVLGARILRAVPFLAPHIPIVELHHERPDGQGYPYGLHADATPLNARIVHVADAYDAMTSPRPYRAHRSDAAAMTELWRHAGSQFDAEVVEALARSPRPIARAEAQVPTPVFLESEPVEAALV